MRIEGTTKEADMQWTMNLKEEKESSGKRSAVWQKEEARSINCAFVSALANSSNGLNSEIDEFERKQRELREQEERLRQKRAQREEEKRLERQREAERIRRDKAKRRSLEKREKDAREAEKARTLNLEKASAIQRLEAERVAAARIGAGRQAARERRSLKQKPDEMQKKRASWHAIEFEETRERQKRVRTRKERLARLEEERKQMS